MHEMMKHDRSTEGGALHSERLRLHFGTAPGELSKIVELIRAVIGEEGWSVWDPGRS